MKKIFISAPSQGIGIVFRNVMNRAIKILENTGEIEVILGRTVDMTEKEVLDNPRFRAEELAEALISNKYDGIISLIGGDDSIKLLPYLDEYDFDECNTWIMGFSDATQYLTYLSLKGVECIYGPSILAGIAQADNISEKFQESILNFIINRKVTYPKYSHYYNDYYDWNQNPYLGQLLEVQSRGEYKYINSEVKQISGKLIGGCIESFNRLIETPYFPELNQFENKTLFIETSSDIVDIEKIKNFIYRLNQEKVFNVIQGLMVGTPKNYNIDQSNELYEMLEQVLVKEIDFKGFIICNLPIGHTTPIWLLPLNKELCVVL